MNIGIKEFNKLIVTKIHKKLYHYFRSKTSFKEQSICYVTNSFGFPQFANGWLEPFESARFLYRQLMSFVPIWLFFHYRTIFKLTTRCIKNTNIEFCMHFKNGLIHNEYGPSSLYGYLTFHLDGKEYTQEAWFCELLNRFPERRKKYLYNQDIFLNNDIGFWTLKYQEELNKII